MTEAQQTEEMKRYLFHEMSAEESDALEERYFEDAGFFYDLLELENDLIDRYAVGKLQGEDLVRFGKSLEKSPERLEKISDARVLQKLIAEEKSKPVAVPVVPSFGERIGGFFNFRISGFQLAAGALAILLVCAAGFWLYLNWQNWQTQPGFAEIERQREAERVDKENRLKQLEEEKRIEDQRRENESNNLQAENSNINTQQNRDNQQSEKRKKEIEKLKNELEEKKTDIPPSNRNEVKSSNEVLAVAVLPIGENEISLTVGKVDKAKARFTVKLPKDNNYASLIVVLKGKKIKTVNIVEGRNLVAFNLPRNVINDNEIDIQAASNTMGSYESIGRFKLKVKKRKK